MRCGPSCLSRCVCPTLQRHYGTAALGSFRRTLAQCHESRTMKILSEPLAATGLDAAAAAVGVQWGAGSVASGAYVVQDQSPMSAIAPLPVQYDDALPEWREDTGPLGSGVLSLRGGDPGVFKACTECLSKRFRKGWYDLTGRVAVFMAPSVAHEVKASDVANLVLALCRCKSLAVVHLRSATSETEDKQQVADPDESFFLAEKAERFRDWKPEWGWIKQYPKWRMFPEIWSSRSSTRTTMPRSRTSIEEPGSVSYGT